MTSRTSSLLLALLLPLVGGAPAQGLFAQPFPSRTEATVDPARRAACRRLETRRRETRAALAARAGLEARFREQLVGVLDQLARVSGGERLAVVYAHTKHRDEERAVESLVAGYLEAIQGTPAAAPPAAYPLPRMEDIQAFLTKAVETPGDGTTLALRFDLLLFLERTGAGVWLGSPIGASQRLADRARAVLTGRLDETARNWVPPEEGHEISEILHWLAPALAPLEEAPPATLGAALDRIGGRPPASALGLPPSLLYLAGEDREPVPAPGPGFLSGAPVGPRPFQPRRGFAPRLGPAAQLLLLALVLVAGLAGLAHRRSLRLHREIEALRSDPTRGSDTDRVAGATQPPLPTGGEALPGWLRASLDPELLRRYSDLRILGSGGMGTVMSGHDDRLGRDVAIKVPPPHLLERPSFRLRFLREARALARLDHPNVTRIYDVVDPADECVPGIVMELLTGHDLSENLKTQGPASLAQAARWVGQAAAALAHAHDAGILHRDVKPANLFLDPDKDEVRLVDFGLAALDDDEMLTTTGAVMGSRPFMSPEQLRGEPVDGTTDQYALAASYYYLVTGELPFDPGRAIRVDVPRLDQAHPEASERLGEVVARALALHPGDRFPDVTRFAAELAAAV